jgi:hypothetical protein
MIREGFDDTETPRSYSIAETRFVVSANQSLRADGGTDIRLALSSRPRAWS